MIELSEVNFPEGQPVDGYGPGFFRLGEHRHEGPMLLTRGGLIAWRGLDDLEPLLGLAGQIDVLLVGTGAEIAPLPAAFRTPLEEAGIGVEQMASPPACRTYNVLLAEARRVALAALPV